MPKAIVTGLDFYNYIVNGEVLTAAEGDVIDVSTAELARGEKMIGPRGPALVTPQAKAQAAVDAANTAYATAKAAADAAMAAARAAAEEAGVDITTVPDAVTDDDIAGMTVAEIRQHLADVPGDVERVRTIETASANPRKSVLELLPAAPAA